MKLAVAAGADVVVVDGLQGWHRGDAGRVHRARRDPDPAAVRLAAEALREIGKHHEVQLIVSGGIRSGPTWRRRWRSGRRGVDRRRLADRPWLQPPGVVGRRLDQWVDATDDYDALGAAPGYCHHCHTGLCPVGITTQEPELEDRLDPEVGARWMTNYLRAMTMELTTLARACGKSDVHNLEPEDLVALRSRPQPWRGSLWPAPTGSPAGPDHLTTRNLGAFSPLPVWAPPPPAVVKNGAQYASPAAGPKAPGVAGPKVGSRCARRRRGSHG